MAKQLSRELFKNKLFVFLLFVLTVLTSSMYFFVRFSIDGNLRALLSLPNLSGNEALYLVALRSNSILARNFLLVLTCLTAFVFVLFFYRFFRTNRKQMGCLKSLGFKDNALCRVFVLFAGELSLVGAAVGVGAGYLASDVINSASVQSYQVSGLVRQVSLPSLLTGLLVPVVVYCIVAALSYSFVRGKEAGTLLSGNGSRKFSGLLRFADRCANVLPLRDKFPLRIALRKPVTVVLIIGAVMGFSAMFLMGYSLNLSSQKVFRSQTEGHNYLFDTHFDSYQVSDVAEASIRYLDVPGTVRRGPNAASIAQQVIGIPETCEVLALVDTDGNPLGAPEDGGVYIGPSLVELYGFRQGDDILLDIGGAEETMTVTAIAANAQSDSIYVEKPSLARVLELPADAYTGVLSMKPVTGGDNAKTREERLAELDRAAVSNRSSGVINQVIGCVVGCILIFLALLMNFQDSTKDMLILHLMGYRPKAIRKMLIDIYRPIVWASFLVTLWPSIVMVRGIQRSLSIQTEDYMPFQTNIIVILLVFVLLNIIYLLVQATFNAGIRRIVAKEDIAEYTNEN